MWICCVRHAWTRSFVWSDLEDHDLFEKEYLNYVMIDQSNRSNDDIEISLYWLIGAIYWRVMTHWWCWLLLIAVLFVSRRSTDARKVLKTMRSIPIGVFDSKDILYSLYSGRFMPHSRIDCRLLNSGEFSLYSTQVGPYRTQGLTVLNAGEFILFARRNRGLK